MKYKEAKEEIEALHFLTQSRVLKIEEYFEGINKLRQELGLDKLDEEYLKKNFIREGKADKSGMQSNDPERK